MLRIALVVCLLATSSGCAMLGEWFESISYSGSGRPVDDRAWKQQNLNNFGGGPPKSYVD